MKLFTLVLVLAACGGSKDKDTKDKDKPKGGDDDGKVASCNQESIHGCREYRGGNLAIGTEGIEKLCSAVSPGKFAMVACGTKGLIGTCAKPEGKDFFYEGYPMTVPELEKSCKDGGGTFTK